MSVEYQAINVDYQLDDAQKPSTGKVDEHGEVILAEGVCYRCEVISDTFWLYFSAAVVGIISVFLLFLFIPLGIGLGIKAANAWKLYLTKTGIHYRRANNSGCCINKWWFIPLGDIQDIYVNPGTKNIRVCLDDPTKINHYIHWCNRPLCNCVQLNCLVLSHVGNADDFVAAVKQQMAAQ